MTNKWFNTALISLPLLSAHAWGQIESVTYFPPSGSGCNADNSELLASGTELYWSIGLSLELPQPGAGNRFCALRTGLELARAYYPTEIWQEINFGALKTRDGAVLSVSSGHTLFGYTSEPKRFDYPSGTPFEELSKTISWTTDLRFIPQSYWCRADRNPKGLWTSRIAVNGLVERPDAYLVFGPAGQKTTYRWKFSWARCPGP